MAISPNLTWKAAIRLLHLMNLQWQEKGRHVGADVVGYPEYVFDVGYRVVL